MDIYEILLDRLTPFMNGYGFTRYINVFYRLYNNEMLQAITVDRRVPENILWDNVPYWCFDIVTAGIDRKNFDNDWWIINQVRINRSFSDDGLTEQDIQDISPWTDAVENELLDVICRVSTFEQYVDEEVEFLKTTRIAQGSLGMINGVLLAYRTYLTGSFDYMTDYIELYRSCLRETLAKAERMCDPEDITDWPGVYRYRLKYCFENEEKRIAENDLDWIVPIREEMAAEMRHRMRTVLGIDVPEA